MHTLEKVGLINKNPKIYGTFAEIGAGQEVAHAFFKVGHASATIAKTMSAYDMKFSDAIYGEGESYVSRERLVKMLNKEYDLLRSRLSDRQNTSQFFVFANTVATGSQRRKIPGHGWLGVMFQPESGAEPCQAIIHIRLSPRSALLQHHDVGTVGVNLLYACFFHYQNSGEFISSLKDDLDLELIEVDGLYLIGDVFRSLNSSLLPLELVKRGLAGGVIYDLQARPRPPSCWLHRKHLVATRGSFRPLTNGKWEIMSAGLDHHCEVHGLSSDEVLLVGGISMASLFSDGQWDEEDFLSRVEMLAQMGVSVLIANYRSDFSFVQCLNEYSTLSKALVVGTHSLTKVLDESHYLHLTGGLLEALGMMVSHNTTLYLYPVRLPGREVLNSGCVFLSQHKRQLLDYMVSAGLCSELRPEGSKDASSMPAAAGQGDAVSQSGEYVSAEDVRVLIENAEPWKGYVPDKVYKYIKKKKIYGYVH